MANMTDKTKLLYKAQIDQINAIIEEKEKNYSGQRISVNEILKECGAPENPPNKYKILTGRIFQMRGWLSCRELGNGKNRKSVWKFTGALDPNSIWK